MAGKRIRIVLILLAAAAAVGAMFYLIFLFQHVGFLPTGVRITLQLLCAVMGGFSVWLAKRSIDDIHDE